MGSRGPIPKSADVARLEGRRVRPATAPAATTATPTARQRLRVPAWLSSDAAAEWRLIVPELARSGRATPADVAILAAWCTVQARLRHVESELDGASLLVSGYRGDDKPHPLLALSARLRRELVALSAQIGLSPASRARLPEPPPPPPAPLSIVALLD